MDVAVFDFSWYGNRFDPESDRLLQLAFRQRGMDCGVVQPPVQVLPTRNPPSAWLRYDLRSPEDLRWVADAATRLAREGTRIFPTAAAIVAAEDKWRTAGALKKAGVPIPQTRLGKDVLDLPFPVILKPRVGWGARNVWVIQFPGDPGLIEAKNEDFVAQTFIPHDRTLIAAIAAGQPIACIEDIGGGIQARGRVGVIPFPKGAVELAVRALTAVGLVCGTVDLIESPGGLRVLEVNSAPRLTYPYLPDLDLAGPMVEAVVAGWKAATCGF